MKRAFEGFRVNFWMKVQQTADRALKRHPDASVHQPPTTEEKIQNENTVAAERNAAHDQNQMMRSSPQPGNFFSRSISIEDLQPLDSVGLEETYTPSSDAPIEISKLQEILKDDVTTYLKIKRHIENGSSQESVKRSSAKSEKASKENKFFQENIPKPPYELADSRTSKYPEESKTYPVLFSWIKGGKEVYLTGDFSQWRPIKMAKVDCCDFSLCLYLPEGSYAYNFIVDDVMFHDDRMRYVFLIGKRRNKVVVKQEMYEESKALSAEFVNIGDVSTHMIYKG